MDQGQAWIRTVSAALLLLSSFACTLPTRDEAENHEMQLEGVRFDPRSETPVVILKEESGAERRLPIWIGVYEAQSIARGLEKINPPRPNSHDLIRNLIEGIKGRIVRVVITELKGGTYYAVIEVEQNGKRVEVDSRPSDAIAVAIRIGAPVFASEEVLRKASISLSDDRPLDIQNPLPSDAKDDVFQSL